MSIEPETSLSFEDELDARMRLTFVDAAELSHGPYDLPEHHVERIVAAERLARTMKPGEPVLHRVGSLRVVGGNLVELPEIAMTAGDELAIAYRLQTDRDIVEGALLFRNFIPGRHPGWEPQHYRNMPVLVAGEDDIKEYAWQQYLDLRKLESQPNGVPWNSNAPLTELHMFAALAQTEIRMSDVLPPDEVAVLRERLYNDYYSQPHLRPLILDAYAGV